MDSQLLQQVRILNPASATDLIADLLIVEGKITAIAPRLNDIPSESITIAGQGLIVGPGLVDLYSHSGEPGYERRETLATLRSAAAAGGFTRVSILPDTVPPLDNPTQITWLRQQAFLDKTFPAPHLQFWGALTQGGQGKQMTELAHLGATEIIGMADGKPLKDLNLLRRILEYGAILQKPIALMVGHPQLQGNGMMREGEDSIRLGIPGNPALTETVALAGLLEMVATLQTPVHVMRVSTARGVELIAHGKEQGLPVTASTTWMHLLLNTEAIGNYDPNLCLEPPLGIPRDQQALIQGVQEGIIDAIAVDHTPYTYEEKTVAFAQAPPGGIGLELALPLLWEQLVETEQMSALQLWSALSINPQRCLQQSISHFQPGERAELTLFDPQKSWTVEANTLKSASCNTPWQGQTLKGKVVRIWN